MSVAHYGKLSEVEIDSIAGQQVHAHHHWNSRLRLRLATTHPRSRPSLHVGEDTQAHLGFRPPCVLRSLAHQRQHGQWSYRAVHGEYRRTEEVDVWCAGRLDLDRIHNGQPRLGRQARQPRSMGSEEASGSNQLAIK